MASNQVDHSADPVLSHAITLLSADPVLSQANSKRMKASGHSASTSITGGSQLGANFQPSHSSVICGRGKENYNHAGNYRFRMVASMFVKRYSQASTKTEKSAIVSDIVTMIHQAGGMFCKHEKGSWLKVGDHTAREKTSALLRDLLHSQYRSSAKAKIDRRRTDNRNKKESKQSGHHQVDGPGQHADDSSMASWSGGEDDDDKNLFDIDVF
jgi:hypothetical protein